MKYLDRNGATEFFKAQGVPCTNATLKDLAHLKIGSVSEVPTPWLCLQHDLRELGIDPAKLNRIGDRSMAENVASLVRGEIDVAQMFEPFASHAVANGQGIIVHAASARGHTSYTTFLSTRDSAVKNKAAFAAMTRAVAHSQVWLDQHSMDELATVVAPYFGHVPRVDLVAAFTRYKAAGLWADTTALSRAGFERLAASLESGGFISRRPAYEDCVVETA